MWTARAILMVTACWATLASPFDPAHATAQEPVIHFDVPPTATAQPVSAGDGNGEHRLVTIELKLSSMIVAPDVPRIDQWLVQCQPRDTALSIADFAPRTELASEFAGPIQIKKTNEKSSAVGLGGDGSYGHLARVNAGFDRGSKVIDSMQVDRVAPTQAVTASGTINRGRGVFFKLRWTAQQVLEGEKTFQITLRVPKQWRGSLVDVSVIAQARQKTFAGLDSQTKTLGSADFVVAAYMQGDHEAAARAHALFDAESALRTEASQHRPARGNSLTSLISHVTSKLDAHSDHAEESWIDRLLQCRADPHFDKEIRRLPMPVRVAVLDYVDCRDQFAAINEPLDPR